MQIWPLTHPRSRARPLALIAEGQTNREIAEELFITQRTAAHHVSNILTKLTVDSCIEAAAIAHRAGLLALVEKPAG